MGVRAAKAYASNQVQTGVAASDSGSLIIMVYERIFDHLKIGKYAMERGEYAVESFTKAHDLIQQGLLACLDFEEGGEISQSLGAVYEWSLREIISARASKSPEKIQAVIEVLTPLYEAWLQLTPKEIFSNLSADESSLSNPNLQRQVTN
ncbi:flagellar export chaperone FliS [Polynucleobacter sp. AP-Ainpum-60-G11]|uniref:flagellar export chaperone FliS n=1 Tax=Polynucleobacter sp. AP-Ainpum-60-G11 TaxID=2576926 RepID=UPI001BFE773C|nr:flagellar export chaperone FliS [Polynucleobacter sp. AP-Ainpum-60-G11]QWE27147.1 flagellar export chaperone FliS [Polynucleobacter sp. AP-Ainpum-60-G11]